jgi:hypothetical protein
MNIQRLAAWIIVILGMALTALVAPGTAWSSTFTDFTIPAADGQGAVPTGVNRWGSVVGYYSTASGYDSFLWQTSGKVTTIRVPSIVRTFALSINGSGWVVGYYDDGTTIHGFLRNPQYTVLDEPDAGPDGTYATSINDSDDISGVYFDASSVEHGFIRDSSGNYTSFDVAGGTVISALLSQNGEIAGSYEDSSFFVHGYVRDVEGNITTFDGPSGTANVYGINASGEVAGEYLQFGSYSVFVRDALGNITTFDVPGLKLSYVVGIADNGIVYGASHPATKWRGWKYTPAGVLSYYADPNAGPQGTEPFCISGNNKVAGWYTNSENSLIDFEMH